MAATDEIKLEDIIAEGVRKEIDKRDRKIARQQERIDGLERETARLLTMLGGMKKAKDALLEIADQLDPYRYDDL